MRCGPISKLKDIMVLNNGTKFHKILLKTTGLQLDRTPSIMVNFHEQRAITPKGRFIIAFTAHTHKQSQAYQSSRFLQIIFRSVINTSFMGRPPGKSAYLKTIYLFLNQNICCGYSKNRPIETVLLSTQNTFGIMDKKIIVSLR